MGGQVNWGLWRAICKSPTVQKLSLKEDFILRMAVSGGLAASTAVVSKSLGVQIYNWVTDSDIEAESFIMELMVEVVGTVYIWENNVELFSSEDIFFTQLGERMQKIVVGSRRRWPLVDWWLWRQGKAGPGWPVPVHCSKSNMLWHRHQVTQTWTIPEGVSLLPSCTSSWV